MNRSQKLEQLRKVKQELEEKLKPVEEEANELFDHPNYLLYLDSEEKPFIYNSIGQQQKEIYDLFIYTCKNKDKSLYELFQELGNKYGNRDVFNLFRILQITGTISFTPVYSYFEELLPNLKDVEPMEYNAYWNESIGE